MPAPTARGRRRAAATVLALASVTALTLSGLPHGAAAPAPSGGPARPHGGLGKTPAARKGNFDARTATSGRLGAGPDLGTTSAATRQLERQLGTQGVLQMDPMTGTPSDVGRLDGFLTGRSSARARSVALRYVRAHFAALHLASSDLATLRLRRDYVDVAGIHHLSWVQSVSGIEVFGNGLKANVTKAGQLISIQGAPVPGLGRLAARSTATPTLSASQARQAAARDVGGTVQPSRATKAGSLTRWSNHDQAQLVWFATPRGLRLGWSTYVQAGGSLAYQHVLDARTGTVLYRHDAVNNDQDPRATAAADQASSTAASQASSSRGRALVFDNYPGAKHGGKQKVYNLIKHKLLPKKANLLTGAYVIAWSDVNDNNLRDANEVVRVPGKTVRHAQYRFVDFPHVSGLCSKRLRCSWNPNQPYSWRTNRAADSTQGFYFASIYHNYLKKKPFGFTAKAGNFESKGGDPVLLNSLDGANSDGHGFPDFFHVDNANMNTPPDGIPPTMQMYLFHVPGATDAEDRSLPSSSSFDASVILHEYTHGLSNRLVTDAMGNPSLNSIQAGAMGEAWSDFYAEDYLIHQGLERDTKKRGDVLVGKYVNAGSGIRTMGIDCPVKTSSARCQPRSGGPGGYTYGDFSRVTDGPEVHASGEIWAQTLWDLRHRFGHKVTDMLVTRAMELSPADPSYLDMRNAIIQADLAVYSGKHRHSIWRVFANRGMGFYAGTLGSGDADPVQDFAVPPSKATPRATVHGRVLDQLTGRPLVGAVVSITGHDSGYRGDYSAVTNSAGRYAIRKVYVGRYPQVTVNMRGYVPVAHVVTVVPRGTTVNFAVQRDWAAASGGARITSYDGPDYSDFGCGPGGAIDLNLGAGWGSTTGDDQGTPTNAMVPKSIVVKLPRAVTLRSLAVDPSNTCGDDVSSATGDYRIQTSPNGTTWTTAAQGSFTAADVGRLNAVTVATPVSSVAYVRFTMLSPQVPDFATSCPAGGQTGCQFTDLTELEVFGTP